MHSKMVDGIDPDSVMGALFEKKVITVRDYSRLRETPRVDCCQDLLLLLHSSLHPQTFIHLRLALLKDYSWFVDEIDKQLPSLTSQLQQLHLGQATDGQHLLFIYRSITSLQSSLSQTCLPGESIKCPNFTAMPMLTDFYNIWHRVYWGDTQRKKLLICPPQLLVLLHYLEKN